MRISNFKVNVVLRLLGVTGVCLMTAACGSPVRFGTEASVPTVSKIDDPPVNPPVIPPVIPPPVVPPPQFESVSKTFNQTEANGKLDILVIVDNSGSMTANQSKLGKKFSTFISGLQNIDWQASVTTTDLGGTMWSTNGEIVPFRDASGAETPLKIINGQTPNAQTLFENTIARKEWINCEWTTGCGTTDEQPLNATVTAIQKRNAANAGFFRSDADLAVLVISNEDELSEGKNIPAGNGFPAMKVTQPQDVVNAFASAFPSTKKLLYYGIVIQQGDSSCLGNQDSGKYGASVQALSMMTGAITGSICDSDYTGLLTNMASNVKQVMETSYELEETDVRDLKVDLTPADPKVKVSMRGSKVVLKPAPALGTKIDVTFTHLKPTK